MTNSNMHFAVDRNAVTSGIISMQLRNKMDSRHFPSVRSFMSKYPSVCGRAHKDGTNIFDELVPISTLPNMASHTSMIRSRMLYEYNIDEGSLPEMGEFVQDFYELHQAPEIKRVVDSTVSYKNTIERLWRLYEGQILKNVKSILGYQPENVGRVNAYIMYPLVDTHRTYQVSEGRISLFFGKAGEKDRNKILAFLTHQAVHQPMLPYKPSMTKAEKEEYHAIIKFLADKETYTMLSGRSYLDIITPGENHEVMARVYPYWLGYRYRNADKQGLNPASEIRKAIGRDTEYYRSLPPEKQALFQAYEFEKLSPEKIAAFFKDKRGYTPYQLASLDLSDRSNVLQAQYVDRKQNPNGSGDGR